MGKTHKQRRADKLLTIKGGVKVFDCMIGLTMTSVEGTKGANSMVFTSDHGKRFEFYHALDCCESVVIEDVCGDIADLVGSPLIEAEEVSNQQEPYVPELNDRTCSYTWSFYRFSTSKGTVVVRWLGLSNGCYSEQACFREVLK